MAISYLDWKHTDMVYSACKIQTCDQYATFTQNTYPLITIIISILQDSNPEPCLVYITLYFVSSRERQWRHWARPRIHAAGASFMHQSRCSFLNAWENTQVARAMTSVFVWNTRWNCEHWKCFMLAHLINDPPIFTVPYLHFTSKHFLKNAN